MKYFNCYFSIFREVRDKEMEECVCYNFGNVYYYFGDLLKFIEYYNLVFCLVIGLENKYVERELYG